MQFIVFDLEATCWDGNLLGREQEIIEIGALRVTPFGDVTDRFQRFVRPTNHPRLSVYCKELTHIEQSDIDAAHSFAPVCQDFIDWIGQESFVIFSWGSKDHELLETDCINHDVETDWLDHYIDLKDQYHRLKGISRKRGLKHVLRKEGIEFEGAHHRALDDAANLTILFTKYLDSWMY